MSEQHCLYCHGKLAPQRVARAQQVEGHWVVIENLPALVCTQCGERFYTPETHDLVLALAHDQPAPVRRESVAVYDAAKVAKGKTRIPLRCWAIRNGNRHSSVHESLLGSRRYPPQADWQPWRTVRKHAAK